MQYVCKYIVTILCMPSPGVATSTVARCLRIDVHDDNDDNDNDNAWQRGPLWPHGMGPINLLLLLLWFWYRTEPWRWTIVVRVFAVQRWDAVVQCRRRQHAMDNSRRDARRLGASARSDQNGNRSRSRQRRTRAENLHDAKYRQSTNCGSVWLLFACRIKAAFHDTDIDTATLTPTSSRGRGLNMNYYCRPPSPTFCRPSCCPCRSAVPWHCGSPRSFGVGVDVCVVECGL